MTWQAMSVRPWHGVPGAARMRRRWRTWGRSWAGPYTRLLTSLTWDILSTFVGDLSMFLWSFGDINGSC